MVIVVRAAVSIALSGSIKEQEESQRKRANPLFESEQNYSSEG